MDDIGQLGPAALAALATGAGAPVWAAAITMVIGTLKSLPEIASRFVDGYEKLWAFVLAGILEVLAFITAVQAVPPSAEASIGGVILAVMAWFTVARLAMATHDDLRGKPGSLTGPTT